MRVLMALMLLPCALYAQRDSSEQRFRKPMVAITTALVGAAMFDIEVTAYGIRHGKLEEKHQPARSMFGEEGRRTPVYIVAAIGHGTVMAMSYRWRERGKWYWWVAPVTLTAIHSSFALKGLYIMHKGSAR